MQHLIDPFVIYLTTQQCVAHNTSCAYRRDVTQFIHFWKKLSAQKRKDWRMTLVDFRDFLRKQDVGSRSISRKLSALRAFFRYVHDYHPTELAGVDMSLAVGLPPRLDRRLPRVCSPSEIEALLQVAKEQENGVEAELICYLLYTAGLRVSELIHLSRSAINTITGHITLQGKGGKMRTIPLIPQVRKVVERYDTLLRTSTTRSSKKYISGSRQTIWRLVKKLAKLANIMTPVSPHVLRHSLATHSLEEGWDLRSLQLLLGHERIATTEMYIHLDTKFVKSEYKKRHPRG